jgi:hypothetical protein
MIAKFLHAVIRAGRTAPQAGTPVPTTFEQRLDAARTQARTDYLFFIERFRPRGLG